MYHSIRPLKKNRIVFIFSLFSALFVLITLRLYVLQIIHADYFKKITENTYAATVTLPSRRGTIFDRTGKPLALTRHALSAFIYRDNIKHIEETENAIQEHFPLVWQRYKDMSKSFFWVEQMITQKRMEELKELVPDISFIYQPTRWYKAPYLPHITGFTNNKTKGIAGVEASADHALSGMPMTMHVQEDPLNSKLSFLHNMVKPGTPGRNITLSCDQTLQFLLTQELEALCRTSSALSGCCLVLNPHTGEVIVMTQTPTFNPNNPTASTGASRRNHIISTCYELGSLMHVFAGLAALSENTCTLEEEIECNGSQTVIDSLSIRNDIPLEKGTLKEIIQQKNNVGIAHIGKKLDKKLYENLKRMGFGQATGIELGSERSGFLNPPERWSATSPLSLSLGYEIMGTVLQIGRAASLIANGGYAISPTLAFTRTQKTGFRLFDKADTNRIKEIIALPQNKDRDFSCYYHEGKARMLIDGAYSDSEFVHTSIGIIEKGSWSRVLITCVERPDDRPDLQSFFQNASQTVLLHDQMLPKSS